MSIDDMIANAPGEWARVVMSGHEIEHDGIIIGGVRFKVNRKSIFHGGKGGIAYTINGVSCDAREFELRLADCYQLDAGLPLGLNEMIAQSMGGPCQQRVLINGQPHKLRVTQWGDSSVFYLDGVEVPKNDFERYLRSSSLPRGNIKTSKV
jgi:hypothetical protein